MSIAVVVAEDDPDGTTAAEDDAGAEGRGRSIVGLSQGGEAINGPDVELRLNWGCVGSCVRHACRSA